MDHLTFVESLKWFSIIVGAGVVSGVASVFVVDWIKRRLPIDKR